jgi:thiol-disulfide isomerase/thioredoxin
MGMTHARGCPTQKELHMKKAFTLWIVLVSLFAFAQDDMNHDAMMMIETHAWGSAELVNARTGEPFKIADYAGKPIYIETFATWCPNCQKQLTAINEAQMKSPEVVYIALSVEGDITDQALTKYADDNSFANIIFAKATSEVLESLVMEFGADITNPPSTPHFFISSTGEASELITGIEGANKIAEHFEMMAGN